MPRRKRIGSGILWCALVTAAAAGGFGAFKFFAGKAVKPGYLSTSVERGDIALQVGASGTLAAVTTVQVGTQVSGTIAELYADYNAEVKKGQVLARLDPALFQAQVEQQKANVSTAEANLNNDAASIASARANLEKARVDVLDKQRKLKRTGDLFKESLVPRDDLDTAQAAMDAALATQKAAEAQIESAQAGRIADQARLTQARASLESARLNLANTIITSPISGTIISRNVDKGQTVAASFASPTLFQIGEDLTKMQVNTNIDEADVARIKTGMNATFTVDAYSGEVFSGTLSQIRLAASTVQNVVTYNAIIDVANPQLRLKPGMTAMVKILIRKVEDVLMLPNSALRFKPSLTDLELKAAYQRAGEDEYYSLTKSMTRAGTENPRGEAVPAVLSVPGGSPGAGIDSSSGGGVGYLPSSGSSRTGANLRALRTVWILSADGLLRPVLVVLGLTDGTYTQIIGGRLKQGDGVITGLESDAAGAAKNTTSTTRAPGFSGGGPPSPPR
ncbi:MAG TPA: efflux RND transporter periplasmic adaptor subunit [Acidobacteriota bacterium]|nr:efflux RND transporter periplasmic adaptor subunit [Acidobacteriota bacterium]